MAPRRAPGGSGSGAVAVPRSGGGGGGGNSGNGGGSGADASAREAAEAAKEKGREAARQQRLINPVNYKHNVGVVYFLRIYTTIVAGAVVGVLGVTGWAGFLFYFVSQALCALPVVGLAALSAAEQAARARRRPKSAAAAAGAPRRLLLPPPPSAPGALALVVPRCFHAWPQVLTEHVFGQTAVLSYLLCWMIFYNLAHVF